LSFCLRGDTRAGVCCSRPFFSAEIGNFRALSRGEVMDFGAVSLKEDTLPFSSSAPGRLDAGPFCTAGSGIVLPTDPRGLASRNPEGEAEVPGSGGGVDGEGPRLEEGGAEPAAGTWEGAGLTRMEDSTFPVPSK